MKANANQLRTALDSASPAIRLYLLHGPDTAGALEWAARLARAMGPDAERIDIEGTALRSDPGRLAAEAASLSLFGGARHIRVAQAGEECLEAFTQLLGIERAGNPVVAIAPSAKATSKIVKLALASPAAMSFACYQPDGADAERMASMIALEHGLRTTGDSASRLVAASGGDRAIMAREVEKLALFLDAAPDRPKALDDAAIDAVGADMGDAEMARAIAAAIDGRPADLGHELARLAEAGTSPVPLLRGMIRRLVTLAELRADVDAGASPAEAVERQHVFFRERASTARALRHWNSARINAAIDRLRVAERGIMASANAGSVIADQACMGVARIAARNN